MNRQLVSRVWVWLPISRVPLHWGQHHTALFVQWNFWRKEGNKQFCYGFFEKLHLVPEISWLLFNCEFSTH